MASRHTFEESSNPLAQLDYIPLLDRILQSIKKHTIFKFSPDRNKLRISAYDIAYELALDSKLQSQSILNKSVGIQAATVKFKSETEFYSKIQAIRDELKQQLDRVCGENQTQAYLENICTSLSAFNQPKPSLPLNYPFGTQYDFKSQRLILENSLAEPRRRGGDSVIKAHHLNVKFEGISQFETKLVDSLKLYIDRLAAPDTDDWQDLTELLTEIEDKDRSELAAIRKIVDTESLPRLLRDIKIDYLDYLRRECAKTNIPNSQREGFECLETLIYRLKLLSEYVNNPDLDDSHFEISYLGVMLNLRTAFSQANAFDILPIIADYEGVIGESVEKERGRKEFNLGLRLKLNGAVNVYNEHSAFDYYTTELDPNSDRHQSCLKDSIAGKVKSFKSKVLRIACLYYFIFAVDSNGKVADRDYNPILNFEAEVLNQLKPGATSDAEVQTVLGKIKNLLLAQDGWRVEQKLESLTKILQTFLKRKELLPPFSKPVQLCINTAILNKTSSKILNSRNFFKIDLDPENKSQAKAKMQEVLGYMEVTQPTVSLQSLTSLAVTFTFDDVRYFTDGNQQDFSMQYDITGIKALPVVFSPIGERKIPPTGQDNQSVEVKIQPIPHSIYRDHFEKHKILVIYYKSKEVREIFKNIQSPETRIYRQVFTLLSYLCISICREQISLSRQPVQEKLFIPIFRFHLKNLQNTKEDEVFLNSLSKALAHILRRDCLADAQGLNVGNAEKLNFRIPQALSSLYALVPKTFEFKGEDLPQLDKLAIIVVSSWLSDAVWDDKDKASRITNIYGEIVVINKISDTSVKIEPVKTFVDNQPHSKIYTEPEIVRDEISKFYQQGYRHFLYIAKAPYSRSLGLTKLESDPDSLFFMSPDVVKYLKQGKPEIKFYPIFMDTYPAINLTSGTVESLYIPDIEELEKLSLDTSQQTRVFLNLFTGKSVDKKRTFFNSVVCYSTLRNIYDVADTRDIMAGLLDKKSVLQQTILQYITLFHFSRYEVNRNIAFKLNPYSKLIGDEGIGTISTYTYTNKNVKFNNLAFLTSIRSALYGR